MFTTRDIVFGVAVPVILSAIVLVIAWRPWRDHNPIAGGYWAGPVALAASLIATFIGVRGRLPPFPPVEVTDWLPFAAGAVAALGLVDAICQMPRAIRWPIAGVCIASVIWLLLRPLPVETMNPAQKFIRLIAFTAGVGGWWCAIDGLARHCTGVAVPRDLLVVAATSSLVLMMSGSKLLGQLGGALAASLGAFVLLAFFGRLSLARGSVLVFVTMHAGLLICGRFYASLTGTNALLLAAGSVLTAAPCVWPVKDLTGWRRHVVRAGLVAIPCAVALGAAAVEFAASMAESAGDYGY